MAEGNMSRLVTISVGVFSLAVEVAGAGEITFSRHEVTGSGTANVFDGGAPHTRSVTEVGTDDSHFFFEAYDFTGPGFFGAAAIAFGGSVIDVHDDRMDVVVELRTHYIPAFGDGGANPGGMSEASLHSVVEFVMPADELELYYILRLHEANSFPGATSVLLENVTQSSKLLSLISNTSIVATTLVAETGDVMRLTTLMSGGGSTGPSAGERYISSIAMTFVLPEPCSVAILAVGAAAVLRRRRRLRG